MLYSISLILRYLFLENLPQGLFREKKAATIFKTTFKKKEQKPINMLQKGKCSRDSGGGGGGGTGNQRN